MSSPFPWRVHAHDATRGSGPRPAWHLAPRDPQTFRAILACLRRCVPPDPRWPPALTATQGDAFLEAQPDDVAVALRVRLDREALALEPASALATRDLTWDAGRLEALARANPTAFALQEGDTRPTGLTAPPHPPTIVARRLAELEAAAFLPHTELPLSREGLRDLLQGLARPLRGRRAGALDLALDGSPPLLVSAEKELSRDHVRIVGREHLLALAPLLPHAEWVQVHVIGAFLPTWWLVGLGEATLTLVLPGWSAKDPVSGARLDRIRPTVPVSPEVAHRVGKTLAERGPCRLGELAAACDANLASVRGAAEERAHAGLAFLDRESLAIVPRARFGRVVPPERRHADLAAWPFALGTLAARHWQERERGPQHLRAHVEGETTFVRIDGHGLPVEHSCTCRAHAPRTPCHHVLALREDLLGAPLV